MNDSSLKVALAIQAKRPLVAQPLADNEEEYQAFNFGRISNKPQFTIGFRNTNGFTEGFCYADFRGWTASDPATGFELVFVGKKLSIEGRNLERILQLIRQQKLTDLVTATRAQAMLLSEQDPVVLSIRSSRV